MSLNLTKGQRIDLTKDNDVKNIKVCLGWDVSQRQGEEFDLDASAFLLTANEKCASDSDVVFYNQPKHSSGSVVSSGDDRTGAGNITHSTDKEIITVKLDQVPKDKEKISFVASIFDAKKNNQNFGMVRNSFIRVVNADNNTEILRYDLTEDYSTSTAIIAGEVYRKGTEWKFAAVGVGILGGLEELARKYGINV